MRTVLLRSKLHLPLHLHELKQQTTFPVHVLIFRGTVIDSNTRLWSDISFI
jgi:hypothetical protein